ncbi:uncharacterized protein LDX57_006744 [Aspergillus melleus]|uniref:uncharacterized protein n=1 Tax=Aspergillus melleus TaxID=138277 RepID=UPI001E8EE873|nr:uncharacterized protein LDX57_006744 [Aspergillus melleus]KAH8429074.1 hypothetical protein LDX57_006744 [Aspergillus melleus]
MDLILKRLWAQVLDAMEDHLEDDDKFFEIGGNSINAVRLAEATEEMGYALTVSDLYRHPELSQMSSILKPSHGTPSQDADPAPFELLAKGNDLHGTLARLSTILRVSKVSIEDVYPCTALQEGLMALSMRSSGSYILQYTFRFPVNLNTARLQEAWEKVLASSDVLRARIARLDDPVGLFQVILKPPIEWQSASGLEAYLAADARMSTL